MTDTVDELYGTDLAFKSDFVPTATGDLDTSSGLDNLREAIFRRIFTTPGSIIHRPNYGVGLKNYLNGINSLARQQALATAVREQLLADPRVESVTGLRVVQSVANEGQVTIFVSVKPVGYSEISVGLDAGGI